MGSDVSRTSKNLGARAGRDIHPTAAPYPTLPSLLPSLLIPSPGTSHHVPKTRQANHSLRMPQHKGSAAWTRVKIFCSSCWLQTPNVRGICLSENECKTHEAWGTLIHLPRSYCTIPFPALNNCFIMGHRNTDLPAKLIFSFTTLQAVNLYKMLLNKLTAFHTHLCLMPTIPKTDLICNQTLQTAGYCAEITERHKDPRCLIRLSCNSHAIFGLILRNCELSRAGPVWSAWAKALGTICDSSIKIKVTNYL